MKTIKTAVNKRDIYHDLMEDIAFDLLITGEQLRTKVFNFIKMDYDADKKYEWEHLIEKVSNKLNKTQNEDLIILRDFYNSMDKLIVSYLAKSRDYFNNEENQDGKNKINNN